MEKRMQKRSLVKILLLAAIALCTGFAIMFAGLNTTKVSGAEEKDPVATYYLGAGGGINTSTRFYYSDIEEGWDAALTAAKHAYAQDYTSYVKVVLSKDWTANADETGFNSNSTYSSNYDEGRLLIPSNANIELDLYSRKLNRNLKDTSGVANGQAIVVEGNLTVTDTSASKAGAITGGYNTSATSYGGGIHVKSGAKLTLDNGAIQNNTAAGVTAIYGIGVAVEGTFQMNGGSISGNVSSGTVASVYGGGVAVLDGGTFQMNGGTISGNAAVYGGGVASYNATGNAITVIRGSITGNNAVLPSGISGVKAYGGGIYVSGASNTVISGGEISKNTSSDYGAGISVVGTSSTTPVLTVSGGRIDHNVAVSLNSDVYGGGVSVDYGKLNVTNGSIQNNYALGANSKSANGGGVYVTNSTLALSGGTIGNNKARSLATGVDAAALNGVVEALKTDAASDKVVNGTATNGGGVYVDTTATLAMTGASVTGNSAVYGGGVYANGTVELGKAELTDKENNVYTYYGGSIYANSATYGGGVYPATNKITFAGKASVTNNTTLGADTANNLWLLENTKINTGMLTTGAKVYVTLCGELYDTTTGLKNSVVITSGFGDHNAHTVKVGNDIASLNALANPYNYFAVDPIYLNAPATAAEAEKDPHPATALYLLATGNEVNVVKNDVVFYVEDAAGTKTEYTLSQTQYRYVEFTYGKNIEGKKNKEGEKIEADKFIPVKLGIKDVTGKDVTVENKAGVTTVTSAEGASFSVVILTRELSAGDVTVTLDADEFEYDGSTWEPLKKVEAKHWNYVETATGSGKYEYKLVDLALTKDTDYTVDYARNKNVGTAIITITFKGNYSGTVIKTFEIIPEELEEGQQPSHTMAVSWEYYDDTEAQWKTFTSGADLNGKFVFKLNTDELDVDPDGNMYEGVSYSNKIRAILTVSGDGGEKQAIYIENIANPDTTGGVVYNPSMWLTFSGALSALHTQFRNADTYTILINGKGNYPIDGVRDKYDDAHPNPLMLKDVKLSAMELTLENDAFEDGADNRLWQLITGAKDEHGNLKPTALLDSASYSDHGTNNSLEGAKYANSVAWYTGKLLYVQLDLSLADSTLAHAKSITYTHQLKGAAASTRGVVGVNGAKNEVVTSALIEFGSNFKLLDEAGKERSVTIKENGKDVTYKNAMLVTKTWYIVTRENNMYMSDGKAIDHEALKQGWTFGNLEGDMSTYTFRAEHGDTVIYSYFILGYEDITQRVPDPNYPDDPDKTVETTVTVPVYNFVDRFALVYSEATKNATPKFYNVSYDGTKAELEYPINDSQYLQTFNSNLRAGKYKVVVTVTEQEQNGSHTHWWDGSPSDPAQEGAVYYNSELTYEFEIAKRSLEGLSVGTTDSSAIKYTLPDDRGVEYNGKDVNLIDFRTITLNGITLTRGVDYELSAASHTVGWTSLIVEGMGSLEGKFEVKNALRIDQAINRWEVVPSIISWSYNNYDKEFNLISGQPKFLDEGAVMYFAISRDSEGKDIVSGLERISLDPETKQAVYIDPVTKKKYDTRIAKLLTNLPAGTYYLIGHVELVDVYKKVDEKDESPDAEKVLLPANYTALTTNPIPFAVLVATNNWKVTPAVESWTQGKFGSVEDHIRITAAFGEPHVKVYDSKNEKNVYYDTDEGINRLSEAKAGSYTLKAWVDGDANYSKLDEYTVTFQIFKKPGLPWWATMLVAVGALAAAALVIFILWKKGVFQILTEKIVVAIRTRASVEATIASVRAAKMMEEGRQSVADAKRRERIEQLRKRAQELRDMSPEERAAQLEAKAQAEAARAEKLRARSEANQAKADKMRSKETEAKEEAPNTDAKKAKPEGGAKKAKEESAPVEEPKKAEESAPVEEAKETAEVSKEPEAPTEE